MSDCVSPPPQKQISFFFDVIAAVTNARQTANQDFELFWNKYFSKINTLNETSSRDELQDIDLFFEKRKIFSSDDESIQNLLPRTKSRKKHKRRSISSQSSSSQTFLYYPYDSSCSTSPRPTFSHYQPFTPEKHTSPPRATSEIPKNKIEAILSPVNSSPVRISIPIGSSKPEKRVFWESLDDERLTPSKIKMIEDNEIDKRIAYLEDKIRSLQFKIVAPLPQPKVRNSLSKITISYSLSSPRTLPQRPMIYFHPLDPYNNS